MRYEKSKARYMSNFGVKVIISRKKGILEYRFGNMVKTVFTSFAIKARIEVGAATKRLHLELRFSVIRRGAGFFVNGDFTTVLAIAEENDFYGEIITARKYMLAIFYFR